MTYQQKINEIGKTCGLLLVNIPFYYFIKMYSISEAKNKMVLPPKISKSIASNNVRVTAFLVSAIILSAVSLFITLLGPVELSSILMTMLFLVLALALAIAISAVISGNNIGQFLNSVESVTLTNSQRYELSKFVGASFGYIPFYKIINWTTNLELIKTDVPQYKNWLVASIVFYIIEIICQFINNVLEKINVITLEGLYIKLLILILILILSTTYYIISIWLGVKLSKLIPKHN